MVWSEDAFYTPYFFLTKFNLNTKFPRNKGFFDVVVFLIEK